MNMKLTDQWIVGFVDGDGCFRISKTSTGKKYCFIVSQNKRSENVLYALKNYFGCGSVNKAGSDMREYRVSKKEHMREIILPFFIQNPLQTSKFQDFKILYEDLFETNLIEPYPKPAIGRDWLIGFIDAEGNFYVSMVKKYPRPQLSIGLHLRDKEILQQIKIFIGSGVVYTKRPKKGNSFEVYQISSLEAFRQIIPICTTNTNRCLLRTTKRISFLKFKQIVRIIEQKKHLTDEGIIVINKILDSIR